MLYKFPKLTSHISFRLNRNILYFFSKLRSTTNVSVFDIDNYFTEDFSLFLKSKKQETLRELFKVFFDNFVLLTPVEKSNTLATVLKAQKIDSILSDVRIRGESLKVSSLPNSLQGPALSLFKYLYSTTLKSYGRLANHYKLIFDGLESNICPFCGIEMLNSPTIMTQDYDHMLLQSQYIFSAVNMYNLVPTGVECNRINKHSIDAISFENNRSIFSNPYTFAYDLRISLDGSTPPVTMADKGNWVINIIPDNDYTKQWAYVYNIRTRYIDNVLNKFYSNWMKELKSYLSDQKPLNSAKLNAELLRQSQTMISNPTTSLSNIVKGAFFEFIMEYKHASYRRSILEYFNQ